VLGRIDGRPVHVVVAEDAGSAATVVVTVYEPDRALWQTDFRPRRKQ
jgi:hypothetical protein